IVTVPSSLRRGNDNNACGRLTRNVIRGTAMSTKTLFSLFVAPAKAGGGLTAESARMCEHGSGHLVGNARPDIAARLVGSGLQCHLARLSQRDRHIRARDQ